jgi:hypothetical protein
VRHLESGEVAAYLDGALAPSDRSRVEAHAAECDMCRTELIEAASLLRARPRVRRWYVPAGAVAAAAAAVVLLIWGRPDNAPAGAAGYREPAVTTSVAPAVVAPRGVVSPAPVNVPEGAPRGVPSNGRLFVWTAVPRADRYRLTLFDGTGAVVWETQTPDTAAQLPDSIRIRTRATYLWKVEAQTGWNRWVSSDLVEFSVGSPRP